MSQHITEKERALLVAIRDDQYQDGHNPVDHPVWTWSVCGPFGTSAGGIVASLVKKGLVGIDNSGGASSDLIEDERTIWLTQAGADALAGGAPSPARKIDTAQTAARSIAAKAKTDPIAAICDACMQAYAVLAIQARPESRYAAARDRLGTERVAKIACDALRAGVKNMLTSEREHVLEELGAVAGFGELAARTRILGVAQLAIEAVIEAARED